MKLRNFLLLSILAISTVISWTVIRSPAAYAQTGGEQWAVIVGVADYQYQPDLTGCTDGSDVYQQLQPIFGSDHIMFLTDAAAKKANIRDTILNWLDPREDADDTVLFFFSGHGSPEYLAPYDALPTSWANDIHSTELSSWLNSLESTKVTVILDSCESGSFINELSKNGRVILTSSAGNEYSWEPLA